MPAAAAQAQSPDRLRSELKVPDSAHVQILTLRDGSTLIGRISAVGDKSVTFDAKVGRLTIGIETIRQVKEIPASRIKDGVYWFENPNSTRLFFAPTGRMLKRGEGYFSDYEIFFPGIAYGVNDHITIGGGSSIFPIGLGDQVYFVTPKIGTEVRKDVSVAAGALIIGGIPDESTAGIVYSVGTFGPPDGSITLGLGYGFSGNTLSKNPVFVFGGEKRVTRRIALVTENYQIPNTDVNPLFSFGVRFMGEKMTADLALMNFSGSGLGIGIPYVDFVIKF